MLSGHIHRLDGHDAAVDEARPYGEPNETPVLQRIPRRKDQKYAKSGIDPKDHLFILRLIGLPPPSRWPPGHHERVTTNKKNQTEDNQRHTEKTQARFEIRMSPPVYWGLRTECFGNPRRHAR